MLKINDILSLHGIDPKDVTLYFSKPRTSKLRVGILQSMFLPLGLDTWLDREDANLKIHEAFFAAPSSDGEVGMRKRPYCMTFVPVDGRKFVMTGLFFVEGSQKEDTEYFESNPHFQQVFELSKDSNNKPIIDIVSEVRSRGKRAPDGKRTIFKLESVNAFDDYRGRVITQKIDHVGKAFQAHSLIAKNNDLQVLEILSKDHDIAPAPDWNEFIVTGPEVRSLPKSWEDELKRWSGVYMILDRSTNERYVGSAYGDKGFLGRWKAHVKGEKGVTKHLSKCDTSDYVFSILERVPFNMSIPDVLAVEMNWMKRLHSKELGLNHGT